ncbi:hypothetical protein FTUN_3080 [Frigoriglobus tundricola]|uniref:Uncharacterized protein n=1 Tax=Frigoriglobus tundricola TaxID=2774151 RepID=A0A6M5YQK9_9BACT|nr:hypothetical protein FTUN_3080 [Frigoriglobus tundricola]
MIVIITASETTTITKPPSVISAIVYKNWVRNRFRAISALRSETVAV